VTKPRPAQLAFVNGSVYTVDRTRPWARAIAVRDGRIVAVGDEVDDWVGGSTDVVDLRGRMLLPGFQDAHIHPPIGGLGMILCDLSTARSLEDCAQIISEYAAAHREDGWVKGGGWRSDLFPDAKPPAGVLDLLVPDRPVVLYGGDGHSAWVNTAALRLAGIDRDTQDPPDGVIVRTPEGEPSGTLYEGAVGLVAAVAPAYTDEDWIAGLRCAQGYLHARGITAWQDAIVGLGAYFPTFEPYLRFARAGELTARVVGSLWWDRDRDDAQIDELIAARERGRVGRFAATAVKILQDGVVANLTASVLEPYLDSEGRPTENRGQSFLDPSDLARIVTRLDAESFQVHFHAIGDRAVREALDAIEAARSANGMNDLRHHIAHVQLIHPRDLPRFAELGVVANCQPFWAQNSLYMRELMVPVIGSERADRQYQFRSLLQSGARLAFGSDWRVTTADPLEEIHVAVNRAGFPMADGGGDELAINDPLLLEERLDLAAAIEAFTLGSAFVNHLDDVTGSIEIGKYADLVVLDRNLFDHPLTEIYAARALMTFVEGERVYVSDDVSD
jgi:predicted amidohydrolase YtcJ